MPHILWRDVSGGGCMESRKVISFGKSSYVVSLPRYWVKENNLKKGDSVFLDLSDGSLTLYSGEPRQQKEQRRITIPLDGKPLERIEAEVTSAYLNNFDVIELLGKEVKEMGPSIKQIIRNLTGMEIIQQSASKVVAKDLLNIKEINLEVLIRRIDNIVRTMTSDVVQCLDECLYESIYERDRDVNRLVFLAYRVIRAGISDPGVARSLAMDNVELLYHYSIVTQLEKLGDQSKRIARHLSRAKLTHGMKEELRGILKEARESYLRVMKAYYKREVAVAFEMEVDTPTIVRRCNSFLKENNKIAVSKVVEYIKGMSAAIRMIDRGVIGMHQDDGWAGM